MVEILDPIIRFEVKADLDGYDSREIEVNAASFSSRNLQLRIALAPSFQPGWHPTLATLSDARRFLAAESTIDRGLALMEQIDKVAADTETIDTFQVRHQYWRVVGLVKACTRCFYQTCDDAAEAVTALEAAIEANPNEFRREQLSKASLSGLGLSIDAAAVNNAVRRANWYLALNEFSRAREEYQRARNMLVKGDAELGNEVGLTLKVLDDNLQLVITRERQQAETSENSTGPESVPQVAESPSP